LLKTLLDFNADVEASGVDGVTPLLHVARGNSASHAMVLLEYGADINATSKSGHTPLTAAITYNNHAVLQLLLDRWFEYSECPRLKGPHLLELVAQYADLETISILASADHLKLRTDRNYMLGNFANRLRQRAEASEKLLKAFEDLLDAMGKEPPSKMGLENRMESGLLSHCAPNLRKDAMGNPDDDSDQFFEDAQENFAPASEDVPRIACLLAKRATI
jgi:ankyrin repeat protein